MSLITLLPKCTVLQIFKIWFTVDDITRLDTSMCNATLRDGFLSLLCNDNFNVGHHRRVNANYFNWVLFRGLKFKSEVHGLNDILLSQHAINVGDVPPECSIFSRLIGSIFNISSLMSLYLANESEIDHLLTLDKFLYQTLPQVLKTNQITKLNLSGCYFLSDEHLMPIIQLCKSLTYVDLSYCVRITSISLIHLVAQCPISYLTLVGCCQLTDEDIITACTAAVVSSYMTYLNLYDCTGVTFKTIESFPEHTTNLTYLNIGLRQPDYNNHHNDDMKLCHALSQLSQLTYLNAENRYMHDVETVVNMLNELTLLETLVMSCDFKKLTKVTNQTIYEPASIHSSDKKRIITDLTLFIQRMSADHLELLMQYCCLTTLVIKFNFPIYVLSQALPSNFDHYAPMIARCCGETLQSLTVKGVVTFISAENWYVDFFQQCCNLHTISVASTVEFSTNRSFMQALADNCDQLTHLDMQGTLWRGPCSVIALAQIIHKRGHQLEHLSFPKELRINSLQTIIATQCAQLTVLNCDGYSVSISTLAEIWDNCPLLHTVRLGRGGADNTLPSILHLLPNLTEFSLSCCYENKSTFCNDLIVSLSVSCPALTSLELTRSTGITHASIVQLLDKCKYLTTLLLHATDWLTDNIVRYIVQHCKYLTHLRVTYCPQLTSSSLQVIAKHAHYLKRLKIHANNRIKQDAVVEFFKERRDVTAGSD